MSPPVHFGAHLSPIHEVSSQEEEEESLYAYNQEAMEPLTFLPEIDSVPLSPASRKSCEHPASPFQPTPSVEDFAVLSGLDIASSNTRETTRKQQGFERNGGWSGNLKERLWSFGASALAALSGESSSNDDLSNSSSMNSIAALDQWPSSDHLASQNVNNFGRDDDWENLEDENETSLAMGFPFSSNSFTFGSAEPQPLLWD